VSLAFTISVAGIDVSPYLEIGSITLSDLTLDFSLIDTVGVVPEPGNAVVTTNPLWNGGTVASLTITQLSPTKSGHFRHTVSVTRPGSTSVTVSAPTKGYSDTPNGTTTWGFSNAVYNFTTDTAGTVMESGSLELNAASYAGLSIIPGLRFLFTCPDLGFTAEDVDCTNMTTRFHDNGQAWYEVQFVRHGLQFPMPAGGLGMGFGTAFPPNAATNQRHTRSDI
jgi:hypothetical protein